jgi:peptidoglycan/LPS O-acetylase OafA/YrhL
MPTGWTDGEWYRWLFAFSPWGVALQFGAGVLAYRISAMELPAVCYRLANHAGALGLLGVYVAGATGVVTQHVPQAIVSGASTALLMIGATSPTATNRLLAHPVLLHIGMVSYSLYLFHFVAPALGFSGKLPTVTEASVLFSIINFVLCTFMAVMLATGIYYLVEVPGRRAIRRVGDEWLGIQRAPKPEVLTKLPLES